jgi:hypothetical protein
VINLIEESNGKHVILIDFSGISIISSSFADEFIGKLLVAIGFYKFSVLIKIVNMVEVIEAIVNRSVGQRMATEYKNGSEKSFMGDSD